MSIYETYQSMERARLTLNAIGGIYEPMLLVVAGILLLAAVLPQAHRWRGWFLSGALFVLLAGEAVLAWFHWRLYTLATVHDPATGMLTGNVAVPLWVESEKLFVWALMAALLGTLMQRHRRELLPGVMFVTAILIAGAALLGNPMTDPIPQFFGQYYGYLEASQAGGQMGMGAFQGMESARQFYYNAWYMWVHPPLLFLSYGCFALSFVATLLMIMSRHSSYETTAYRWARLGYLPLTFGMLIGFPWALAAWQGDSWWWSGKVNMSLMMWLLYTAVLHARLYLRRRNMWKWVAALSVVSFLVLVLTYLSTYLVPGAHSYALVPAEEGVRSATHALLVLRTLGGAL